MNDQEDHEEFFEESELEEFQDEGLPLEEEDEFLINVSSLFVSESLTPIKPIPYPEGPPPDFVWGQLSAEKSRILSFHNYPQNTDVEIEYVFENPPSYGYKEEDAADPRNISISLRYSLIEMPENDFEPRLADQRVGYFTERITNLTSVDLTPYDDLINKWDLQKKNPEEVLSEPVKPITFWLENSTPKDLIPYIKEGVLAWNSAFEKAGFKNAVAVKVQPDDADWDAGDIRYNVLRWTSSLTHLLEAMVQVLPIQEQEKLLELTLCSSGFI